MGRNKVQSLKSQVPRILHSRNQLTIPTAFKWERPQSAHQPKITKVPNQHKPSQAYKMSQAGKLSLTGAMLLSAALFDICITPPNPSPQKDQHTKDRIGVLIGSRRHPAAIAHIGTLPILYHALLTALSVLAPARLEQVCPNPDNMNQALFEWNALSCTALGLMFLGSAVRISAYGGLGSSFTFHLAPPDRLITGGVYRWVQHPSYSGLLGVLVGMFLLFVRWDGGLACWIPGGVLGMLQGSGVCCIAGVFVLGGLVLGARVRDEEGMLRERFGREWEEWHSRTSRIVPGIL